MGNVIDYFKGDELAAEVWQEKYALEGENTPDDMHKRMAKEFGRIEKSYQVEGVEIRNIGKLSQYGISRENLTEDSIYNLFKDFKYIIPQGSIMSQLGAPQIGSLSNCFVIGQPEDSYGGIFQKDEEMAQLMKRRGGVGIDISTLRPSGAATSNAAKTSTGAISFMHRFSNTTREVAQNGRRGALMISMDINHPDIMDFIKIKRDLTQVTGANISIKLNKKFMEAVEKDEDYWLKFPCNAIAGVLIDKDDIPYGELVTALLPIGYKEEDGALISHVKRIKAREYWDEIIKSAHGVAEPGLMYWDNMVEYSPDGVYEQYKQITTNPCSEIGMQPYDACRLIAVNLFSFVKNPFTDEAEFDYTRFYEVNYEAMRLSDDLIDLEIEHIKRIMDKIKKDPESNAVKSREAILWEKILNTATASRRTGLGFTGLGDTLAAMNVKYGSHTGLMITEEIMHTKMMSELDCTIDLAVLRGPFEGWDVNTEFVGVNIGVGTNDFYQFLLDNYPNRCQRMAAFGRRNVSWNTVAPTGTVSLMTQTTSGIEPIYSIYPYVRRKKININDKNIRIDFTDQNGDSWQEFAVIHPKLLKYIEKFKDDIDADKIKFLAENKVTKKEEEILVELVTKFINEIGTPWDGSSANDVNWEKRVNIQSVIQKYITHSISSTINLPNDVSEEEVSNIYMESWKKGIKGITVYRDGSRSGVLVSQKETEDGVNFEYKDAIKRPKSLKCDIHTTSSKGVKYNIIVGLLDKKPYEVFVIPHFTNEVTMDLVKIKKCRYDLIKECFVYSEDITTEMTDEQEAITRLISTSLRHGADIKYLVEQLNKTTGSIFGFTGSLSRVLKKYIPEGAKSTVICNDCGSDQVIFEEGCSKCLNCGSSKCG